jgi:hypothetical protein
VGFDLVSGEGFKYHPHPSLYRCKNMVKDKRLEQEIDEFTSNVIPFGYRDIEEAVHTALEAGKYGNWAADAVLQAVDDLGCKLEDIDPNYAVYEALLQEARNDIEQETGKDILNDTEHQIEVYGNYMCTALDYSDEAKAEFLAIVAEIAEEDRSDVVKWLISELE